MAMTNKLSLRGCISVKILKKILAYRFSAFGDVAMIVPVLKEFWHKILTQKLFSFQKNFADLFDGVERLTFCGVEIWMITKDFSDSENWL